MTKPLHSDGRSGFRYGHHALKASKASPGSRPQKPSLETITGATNWNRYAWAYRCHGWYR